jgi:hypothetical protein
MKFFKLKVFLVFAICFVTKLPSQNFLDDGLAPLQRFEIGQKISGVYSIYNPVYCSQKARLEYLPQVLPTDTVLKVMDNGQQVTIQGNLDILHKVINKALNILSENRDVIVENKHICTGFFQDENLPTGNAYSLGFGYMIFDFKLIQFLYNLPDESRSSWVFDFLALHEFAHQLQFWHQDSKLLQALEGKISSQSSELAADCMASGLIALMNLKLSRDIYDMSYVGVLGAASALGDFDILSQNHHGTPLQRIIAASYGNGLVIENKQNLLNKKVRIDSEYLLNQCNSFVNNRLIAK